HKPHNGKTAFSVIVNHGCKPGVFGKKQAHIITADTPIYCKALLVWESPFVIKPQFIVVVIQCFAQVPDRQMRVGANKSFGFHALPCYPYRQVTIKTLTPEKYV